MGASINRHAKGIPTQERRNTKCLHPGKHLGPKMQRGEVCAARRTPISSPPPLLTLQRLPCEQVDELVKEAAMMIKCENESGKLDEVR